MNRTLPILIAIILPAIPLSAALPESHYQEIAAKRCGGETEVRMADGSRCDIVTEHYAIEVDFANKWKEAIGQSLNYAFQSNKSAGIVLIVEQPTDTLKLMSVIEHYELPIAVWAINAKTFKLERITEKQAK